MTSSLFNSKTKCLKILVIQFKYLGDAVFITPALQAIQLKHPEAEIHLLVAEEVAPIFANIDIIKRYGLYHAPAVKQKLCKHFLLFVNYVKNDLTHPLILLE